MNQAKGASLQDFTPTLSWFKKLQANQLSVLKQTAYARLISGEIPILLDYDFNPTAA